MNQRRIGTDNFALECGYRRLRIDSDNNLEGCSDTISSRSGSRGDCVGDGLNRVGNVGECLRDGSLGNSLGTLSREVSIG